MSTDRHPASARFHQLLADIAELHDRKQRDYGSDTDPFANVRASERWGVQAWAGAMMRLDDKVARLRNFARKGVLANESAEDSMRDIAVYALIALVLYEEASGETLEEAVDRLKQPSGGYSQEQAAYLAQLQQRATSDGPYAAETAIVHPYTPDMSEHSEGQDHLGMEYHEHEMHGMLHSHDMEHRIVMDRSA